MIGIRLALSALAGAAALVLAAAPAVAQEAVFTVAIKGNQVQTFCLGADGRLSECTRAAYRFTSRYEERNAYVISTASGTCLEGAGGSGKPVTLSRCSGGLSQDWYVANGRIQNKATDLCLDVQGARIAAGTAVILWSCGGAENQVFGLATQPAQSARVGGAAGISARDARVLIREGKLEQLVTVVTGGTLIGNHTAGVIGNHTAGVIGNHTAGVIGNATANLIGQAGSNYRVHTSVATVARPHLLPAGERFTCALGEDGAAYCWGRNLSGQLGDGTTTARTAPVKVQGGLDFVALSTGYTHVCALTEDGTAYCWGRGNSGQLGDGTQNDRREPTRVMTDLKFRSVSAGSSHTCGVAEDGTAYCWGFAQPYGQLGDGTNTSLRTTPWPVKTELKFASISAGPYASCGITTSNQAYCWGPNSWGWLGDGTTTDSYVPVAVAGGLSFQSVSVGAWFACGLTTDGRAYCWGDNQNGRLGDGTHRARTTPTAVVGGLTFVSLTAALDHACALTANGQAYCWGAPGFGHLGNGGSTNAYPAPTPVAGGLTFRSLDTSEYHTCGVTVDGTGYCWGLNSEYELGDGTETNRLTPTGVVGWQTSTAPGAGGGVVGASASPAFAEVGDCRDPWISQAVRETAGRRAIGSGDSGECMPALYGRGSWSGWQDLKLKVIAYFDNTKGNTTNLTSGQWTGSCSDVRITRAVLQANDQLRGIMQVRGNDEMGECDPRLYGRWSSETELQSNARQALGSIDRAGLEYSNGGREFYDRQYLERIAITSPLSIGPREDAPQRNWYIPLNGGDVLAINRKCPQGSAGAPQGCLVPGT
jgi:alpha-tubulin suppressor-like RCC1 family protein